MIGGVGVLLFLRSTPLRTSMMITIAAIEATAIAMMTMTLAIIAGLGDKIVLCGCVAKLLLVIIIIIIIYLK